MNAVNAINTISARRQPPWWLRDFRQLRLAVLVFAVCAGGAATAVLSTRALWHDARNRQLQAAQARDQARLRLSQAGQEQRDIALYQPLYRQLQARRLVGVENRLDWIDALRRIQDQYRLAPIAYELAPRQPVVLSPAMDLGRYRLYATRMRVQMDLLHEGDLVALLTGLRAEGHSTVQECTLKRPASPPATPLAPTVTASCTLNWVTLADNAGPDAGHAAGLLPETLPGAIAAQANRGELP